MIFSHSYFFHNLCDFLNGLSKLCMIQVEINFQNYQERTISRLDFVLFRVSSFTFLFLLFHNNHDFCCNHESAYSEVSIPWACLKSKCAQSCIFSHVSLSLKGNFSIQNLVKLRNLLPQEVIAKANKRASLKDWTSRNNNLCSYATWTNDIVIKCHFS